MKARWFDPNVLMRMHYGNLAHREMHKAQPIVICQQGTTVHLHELLPRAEFVRQAAEDFLDGGNNPYLETHPELLAEFKGKLLEFEQLAAA